MAAIQRCFGFVVIIAALHMTEQLFVGLDELYMIRRVLAVYYRQFSNPDFATVLLVTIVVVFVLTLIYGVLLGGRSMHWAMGFFAFISITELHHLIESIAQRRYVPGLVTGVLWAAIGIQLARAILQQSSESKAASSMS